MEIDTNRAVAARNMGDCRGLTWGQMLDRFIDCYGGYYTEVELRRIHEKWVRISAEIGWH
jgi:hypothetical protein